MCEIPGADKLAAESKTVMRSPPQNDSRLTMGREYRRIAPDDEIDPRRSRPVYPSALQALGPD
jgi:hypothetical protein